MKIELNDNILKLLNKIFDSEFLVIVRNT